MYSDKVIDHFMSPRNAHTMPDAHAEGSVGDPACGDCLVIYLKVKDQKIDDISYLVFGCCGAIATASMTSVLAKGKTLAPVAVDNRYTSQVLLRTGWRWPITDNEDLRQFLRDLISLGFFEHPYLLKSK